MINNKNVKLIKHFYTNYFTEFIKCCNINLKISFTNKTTKKLLT